MTIRAADLDLAAGSQRLTELAGDLAPHPEADPEKCRVDAATLPRTLCQTLPGADHRRAGRVLLEATRQLGVLDVLEEGLELVFVLGLERDREISKPDDLETVAVDVALDLGDGLGFDLIGVGRDAEQRPAIGDNGCDDVGPQGLEQLLPHPVRDLVIGREILRPDQVDDQRLRLDDLQRVLAKDAEPDTEVGLRIDDVVDRSAEGQVGELASRNEIELRAEQVPAAGGVDQDAEEGDLRGIEGHPPWLDRALDAAVAKEDRQLVLLNGELGQFSDGRIRPLEENLALCRIRACDELAPDFAEDTHLNLQCWIRRYTARPRYSRKTADPNKSFPSRPPAKRPVRPQDTARQALSLRQDGCARTAPGSRQACGTVPARH